MRRILSFVLLLTLALAMLAVPGLAYDGTSEITIIHDSHMHGNFVSGQTNIAQKAQVINEIRSRYPGALFVGNGDDLGTSILSGEFKGSHVLDAFSRMGMVANTFGNHDFDQGPENLVERVKESKFTWVSANVRDKRSGDVFGAEAGAKLFLIKEVGGLKVGFTGLAPFDTPEVSSPGPNARFLPYAEAMREVLPKMKAAGAEVIVLLSHVCGPDAEKLAAEVEGIHAIVGDHCAGVLEQPKKIGSTLVSRVGDDYRYVGELTLVMERGQVTDFRFTRHAITEKSPSDPAILTLMNEYTAKLDVKLAQVIGATATPLDSMKAHNRFRETSLGNFVSDVTREIVAADVAITNGGGIRAEKIFQPGPLTAKDVIDTLPFVNYIMKLEVTGATIQQALEHGVSSVGEGNGRFPQISGITFRLDPTKPVGQRVSDVKVGGRPLEPAATFTLGVNSFLAGGGDGYAMFKDAKVLVDANSAPLVNTAVIEAIRRAGTIAPRVEGRILYASGVSLAAGKAELKVAGRTQTLDVAPEMAKDGSLQVPLRWVTELYGGQIEWQAESMTALVTMPWGSKAAVKAGVDGYTVNGRMLVPVRLLKQLGISGTETDGRVEFSLM